VTSAKEQLKQEKGARKNRVSHYFLFNLLLFSFTRSTKYRLKRSMAPLLPLLVFLCSSIDNLVDAHGYLSSPRSRNWMAAEDGVNAPTAGLPNREYCPHCLNVNPSDGICGRSSYNNFDDWVDSTGAKMNWNSQDIFKAGQIITVKSHLDTHHNGVSVVATKFSR
jgi:hypothetical protein